MNALAIAAVAAMLCSCGKRTPDSALKEYRQLAEEAQYATQKIMLGNNLYGWQTVMEDISSRTSVLEEEMKGMQLSAEQQKLQDSLSALIAASATDAAVYGGVPQEEEDFAAQQAGSDEEGEEDEEILLPEGFMEEEE